MERGREVAYLRKRHGFVRCAALVDGWATCVRRAGRRCWGWPARGQAAAWCGEQRWLGWAGRGCGALQLEGLLQHRLLLPGCPAAPASPRARPAAPIPHRHAAPQHGAAGGRAAGARLCLWPVGPLQLLPHLLRLAPAPGGRVGGRAGGWAAWSATAAPPTTGPGTRWVGGCAGAVRWCAAGEAAGGGPRPGRRLVIRSAPQPPPRPQIPRAAWAAFVRRIGYVPLWAWGWAGSFMPKQVRAGAAGCPPAAPAVPRRVPTQALPHALVHEQPLLHPPRSPPAPPRQVPMYIVVGRPIPVPRVEQPTPEQARRDRCRRRCRPACQPGSAPSVALLRERACRLRGRPASGGATCAAALPALRRRPAAPASHPPPAPASASAPTPACPAQVEDYLQRFIAELERLFAEHKAAAGHAATTLTIY